MAEKVSCGMTPAEIEAEAEDAEIETAAFEQELRDERDAELQSMTKHERYNTKNRANKAFKQAERRAKRLCALPAWLTDEDRKRMLAVYQLSHALTLKTGIPHVVDHIIPLAGACPYTGVRNVCGLHVPDNLRVTTRNMNRIRGHSFYDAAWPVDESFGMEIPF